MWCHELIWKMAIAIGAERNTSSNAQTVRNGITGTEDTIHQKTNTAKRLTVRIVFNLCITVVGIVVPILAGKQSRRKQRHLDILFVPTVLLCIMICARIAN
jgi:formate-dependent nitrite reductase membrane component NrfD